MELLKHLNWRYATKVFTEQIVQQDKVDQILEAINLTASSCGIQPYRVFAISDPEIKSQLAENSFNTQISQSSHLLVFAGLNEVSSTYIADYVAKMETYRQLEQGTLDGFKNAIQSHFSTQSPEQNRIWSTKQAYIGLGTALVAAAALEVDSTPMEGFDEQVFDRVLGLSDKGLHTSVILALGYRDSASDYLAAMPKFRLPIDEFSTKID